MSRLAEIAHTPASLRPHQPQALLRSGAFCAAVDLRADRVVGIGEVEPEVDIRLGEVDAGWDHLDGLVARRGAITVAYDFDELRQERSVRGEFLRMVEADPALDETVRRKVLTTGLRALSGRADELEVL